MAQLLKYSHIWQKSYQPWRNQALSFWEDSSVTESMMNCFSIVAVVLMNVSNSVLSIKCAC